MGWIISFAILGSLIAIIQQVIGAKRKYKNNYFDEWLLSIWKKSIFNTLIPGFLIAIPITIYSINRNPSLINPINVLANLIILWVITSVVFLILQIKK